MISFVSRFTLLLAIFTSATEAACPSGWVSFKRWYGTYCVKCFRDPDVNFYDSVKKCKKNHNAFLAGFDSPAEMKSLLPTCQKIFHKNDGTEELYIGAYRKPECGSKFNPFVPSCHPVTENAFSFVDGYSTGTSLATLWDKGEPNNVRNESCVTLKFKHTFSYRPSLNDLSCDHQQWIKGYICGKMDFN